MSGFIQRLRRGRAALADAKPAAGTLLTLDDMRAASRTGLQAAARSRCQAVSLDRTTALCRVLGKYKVLVDSRDMGLAPHLLLDGYWEVWSTRYMLRRIRPGQVAWDVGANLGYFALLMADLVGLKGRVLALEPNPRLALLCERNLALNGFAHQARMRRIAASDRAATLRFRAALSDPKNGHLVPPGLPPAEAEEADIDTLEVAVPAMPLDALAEGPVDFVKIDVEGAEEQVWAGMQGMLDRSPAITVLMEFNAFRCGQAAETLRAIADRFPLRELRLDGHVHRVAAADILPRQEDTLLVLTRGEA
jgi:FkbM family methyltransferase